MQESTSTTYHEGPEAIERLYLTRDIRRPRDIRSPRKYYKNLQKSVSPYIPEPKIIGLKGLWDLLRDPWDLASQDTKYTRSHDLRI